MLEPNSTLTPCTFYPSTGWWAKREDLAYDRGPDWPAGAKVRQYLAMADAAPAGAAMVVGCSADSAMQLYVAAAAHWRGVHAAVFVPARKVRSAATNWAAAHGAVVHEVRPGHRSVCMARARTYAQSLPQGVVRWDRGHALRDTAAQCANLPRHADTVVVATGSGLTVAGVLAGCAMHAPWVHTVVAACTSSMAKAENITADAAKLLAGTDADLLPRLVLAPATSSYDTPVAASLPCGRPLDPYYAAKALPHVQAGQVLWVPGLRPRWAY